MTRSTTKTAGNASPTLSDMDADSPRFTTGHPDERLPTAERSPNAGSPGHTMRRLTRYLPSDKKDAFIGLLPPTVWVSSYSPTPASEDHPLMR